MRQGVRIRFNCKRRVAVTSGVFNDETKSKKVVFRLPNLSRHIDIELRLHAGTAHVVVTDDRGNTYDSGDLSGAASSSNDTYRVKLRAIKVRGVAVPGFFDDVEVSRRRDVGSAGATYFVFDPGGRLIGEYDDVGTSNVEYVYIENQPLAMLQGGAIYYYHTDQLGTPQILTDYVQEIGWKANYTPFGDTIFSANIVDNSLRFPGQYFDAETGLHYNYFRDYDPTIGRYITSDRLGLVAGVGTYSYVGANPQRFTDRLGLEGGLPDAFPGVGDFERATGKDILQAALLTLAPGTLFFNPSLAALGAVAGGGGAGATGGSLSDVAIGTVTGIVVGPVAPASGLVRLTLSSVASSLAGQTAVNLRR